jgi:hypothetical protein
MSETHGEYLTDDQRAILDRLLEVFTPRQLLRLADRMGEVKENRFGGVKIVVQKNRMLFERILSDDAGCVTWIDDRKI